MSQEVPNLSQSERMTEVLRLLENRDSVHVTELAETFAVSEVTVRNDLSELARQGLVARVRGGVRALQRGQSELGFDLRLRLEADRNFHSTIWTACHNPFLTQMNSTLGVALRATQQIGVHLRDVLEESVLAHKKVAHTIAKRDSAAARTAMEQLVRQSSEHIDRVLNQK